jgi:DNA-binding XRE family transcriptional regulator
MTQQQWFGATELAALAKKMRESAGETKAQAARALGINRATIQQAEEMPEMSLTKLRIRLIERYSRYRVEGPKFRLRPQTSAASKRERRKN